MPQMKKRTAVSAHACIHTVAEYVDQEVELRSDDGIVAIEGHLHHVDEDAHQNLIAAVENEVLDFLCENLARLVQHLRVFLQILPTFFHADAQPRIELADAEVEGDDANDGEHQANDHPQPEVAIVVGQQYLRDALHDADGLKVGVHEVLLLVGAHQQLLVVEDVARHRSGQKGIEGKVDQWQPRRQMAKPPGEKQADHQAAGADDEAYAAVEVSQHRHHLVDFFMIVFLQRFV